MKKTVSILIMCLALVSLCYAIKVTLFVDIDTLIRRSKDILIAKCLSIPEASFEGGLYPATVEINKILKGKRKQQNMTIATIYRLKPEKSYLFFNSGGSSWGTDFLSVAQLSVVEVPSSFKLEELNDKSLKEQIILVFSQRQSQLLKTLSRLEEESKLLTKALQLEKPNSEPKDSLDSK